MAQKNHKIILRSYYAVQVELRSPLSVSNGEDYYTDSDVVRNGAGEVFVPGTSLAGAFRHYLGLKKNEAGSFGFSRGKEGRMSSFSFSDLYFSDKARVGIRDGVMLSEGKTVENKFDREMIESGAQGTLFFGYVVREEETKEEFAQTVCLLLQGLEEGEIRLGAKKNRGFGRIRIQTVSERTFQAGETEEWLEFLADPRDPKHYGKNERYQEWIQEKKQKTGRYIRIRVPLKQRGGISIRRYSARPDQEDFEHITCNGMPVIPGTSWNGAIRADAREILQELGCKYTARLLNRWFGHVEKEAVQSQVVVAESEIQDAVRLSMTRNRVNRFDASAGDGALYSEASYFNGTTWLELLIRKDEQKNYLALVGILQLVILDLQKGYLAVGGQTAVGRGIFQADTRQEIEYSEPCPEKDCLSALYEAITSDIITCNAAAKEGERCVGRS